MNEAESVMLLLTENAPFMPLGKSLSILTAYYLNIIWSISKEDLEDGLRLLLETAFRPIINKETVLDGINKIKNELTYMKYEKEREKEMFELICQG